MGDIEASPSHALVSAASPCAVETFAVVPLCAVKSILGNCCVAGEKQICWSSTQVFQTNCRLTSLQLCRFIFRQRHSLLHFKGRVAAAEAEMEISSGRMGSAEISLTWAEPRSDYHGQIPLSCGEQTGTFSPSRSPVFYISPRLTSQLYGRPLPPPTMARYGQQPPSAAPDELVAMGTVNGLESWDFGPVGNTQRLILPAGRRRLRRTKASLSLNEANWEWWRGRWTLSEAETNSPEKKQKPRGDEVDEVRKRERSFCITSCEASQIRTLDVFFLFFWRGESCSSMRWEAWDDVIYRWTKRLSVSSPSKGELKQPQREETHRC